MPFNPVTGMIPDILINPAAFPSRMTASQIMEGAMAKISLRTGRSDGSPFQTAVTPQTLGKELRQAGMSSAGTEVLCDGRTGLRIQCQIFVAPTLYQRLKHFAGSKLHARSTGRRNMVTRQPSEGRQHQVRIKMCCVHVLKFIAHHCIYCQRGGCGLVKWNEIV